MSRATISQRNVVTGFSDLVLVNNDNTVVLSGVRDDKDEDVSSSGTGHS